ncbi:hypothetical protein [Streptomyces sp. NPDC046942]|uniref:alpha/beta fold hydrolase n=1 Tax=Streptomyces sp. NPDC046942 TaxID=3155137 RepID=UPI0034072B0D
MHRLSSAALEALDPAALEAAAEETGAGVPAGTAEQVEPVERLDVTADPARITAPTLVVSTAGDALIPPRLHRAVTAGTPGPGRRRRPAAICRSPSIPAGGRRCRRARPSRPFSHSER